MAVIKGLSENAQEIRQLLPCKTTSSSSHSITNALATEATSIAKDLSIEYPASTQLNDSSNRSLSPLLSPFVSLPSAYLNLLHFTYFKWLVVVVVVFCIALLFRLSSPNFVFAPLATTTTTLSFIKPGIVAVHLHDLHSNLFNNITSSSKEFPYQLQRLARYRPSRIHFNLKLPILPHTFLTSLHLLNTRRRIFTKGEN